ncbi:hypothetical protein [Corynebacterium frankenforstense]
MANLCAKLSLVIIALGALTWVAGGPGAIAPISIRQALLVERI